MDNSSQTPSKSNLPLHQSYKKSPFKASFLHLKELQYIRKLPDYTGNGPTLDIYIGDYDIEIKKISNDKCMPSLMNIVIMC